ncbi:hypothetical protein RGQ29_011201 [Quercus rubra]|uniref:RING-type E3 ubiquitin transferase n=1 Tax=Quercus rubra TaxID=3512 RepID=A0AAN7FX92_QUERU|nr:hypothetical protein RGQ29_011201 [Quercus rubra]
MAKFSVGGEEDGEGPSSSPRPKRLRISVQTNFLDQNDPQRQQQQEQEEGDDESYEEEDEEEEGEEEEVSYDDEEDDTEEEEIEEVEEDEEEEAQRGNQGSDVTVGPRSTIGNDSHVIHVGDGSISVTLTDPEVLDCSICLEHLSPPVFQCENGHIACSSCCNKLKNKCPSCFWPIGYNRCRAIEKVLEAVKIPCQNSKYGCKEVVSYSRKSDHEKTCIYAPCSCPLSHCKFIASSKQIYVHFSSKHTNSAIGFKYDSNFSVSLTLTDKFLVLQEQSNGVLFVLNNCVDHRGNVVTINCVGPSSTTGGFSYGLAVKTQGSSLRLESFTKNSQHRVDNPPSTGFLLIPTDFFGSCGQLKLEVYIKRSATCGITSFGIAQGRIGPV